ncbi:MAG: NAD(P)-dependent oxidoreductase [Alphaproteobacteria bacterium]|nr:NAD(P)-dependent oxidoreductase [Alphaproteobacteria bacterium]
MTNALIGHTGFVGSNLAQQTAFTHCYNSSTIGGISGQSFDTVVCAGVRAVKWWANQNAEADWQSINALQDTLRTVRAKKFILISTIDVFADSHSRADETAVPPENSQAYGKHRLQFEEWVKAHFPDTMIVRLPGLFGPFLKKNIIFDLLTNNQLGNINPATSFQWYDMRRLWSDINITQRAGLKLVHCMPAPVATTAIIDTCFPGAVVGPEKPNGARYDIRTVHGKLFGGTDDYMASEEQSLAAIADFVSAVRKGNLPISTPAP